VRTKPIDAFQANSGGSRGPRLRRCRRRCQWAEP
jgi:hypothetical protein